MQQLQELAGQSADMTIDRERLRGYAVNSVGILTGIPLFPTLEQIALHSKYITETRALLQKYPRFRAVCEEELQNTLSIRRARGER